MTDEKRKAFEKIKRQFTSCNDIPVHKAFVSKADWDLAVAYLRDFRHTQGVEDGKAIRVAKTVMAGMSFTIDDIIRYCAHLECMCLNKPTEKSPDLVSECDGRKAKNGWVPGNYMNTCFTCANKFIGAKQCRTCAHCAYKPRES